MNDSGGIAVRRLRYRLKRQGMAELDVWLSALEPALADGNEEIRRAVSALLSCESPDLMAMMHGERDVPAPLRPWLEGDS
ncbi:MAG TPA: succinate dehydrogenase assembly factor 2 [Mariprofundaceae bacterium]|nr:succinate dehydrogenase assembly factor 2 [Mariprofundaceae bacterium]